MPEFYERNLRPENRAFIDRAGFPGEDVVADSVRATTEFGIRKLREAGELPQVFDALGGDDWERFVNLSAQGNFYGNAGLEELAKEARRKMSSVKERGFWADIPGFFFDNTAESLSYMIPGIGQANVLRATGGMALRAASGGAIAKRALAFGAAEGAWVLPFSAAREGEIYRAKVAGGEDPESAEFQRNVNVLAETGLTFGLSAGLEGFGEFVVRNMRAGNMTGEMTRDQAAAVGFNAAFFSQGGGKNSILRDIANGEDSFAYPEFSPATAEHDGGLVENPPEWKERVYMGEVLNESRGAGFFPDGKGYIRLTDEEADVLPSELVVSRKGKKYYRLDLEARERNLYTRKGDRIFASPDDADIMEWLASRRTGRDWLRLRWTDKTGALVPEKEIPPYQGFSEIGGDLAHGKRAALADRGLSPVAFVSKDDLPIAVRDRDDLIEAAGGRVEDGGVVWAPPEKAPAEWIYDRVNALRNAEAADTPESIFAKVSQFRDVESMVIPMRAVAENAPALSRRRKQNGSR